MATITNFLNGMTTARAGFPANGLNKMFVLRNQLDFSDVPVAAADVVQALVIPANTMVIDVLTRVVTAEGAACTADVGDGTDPNGFDDAIDLNATAGITTQSAAGTDAYATTASKGKVYTAADTLDLTMDHATDAAVLLVFAICVDLS
jgi:hypothetical protein